MPLLSRAALALGLVALLAAAPLANAQAQQPPRVGYVNVELVFSLMPEALNVQRELERTQARLQEDLKQKQAYLEGLVQDYQRATSAEEQAELEAEIRAVDKRIKESAQKAEKDLLETQQQLLEPLQTKIQEAIDAVADANGFTHVFSTTAGGASILLKGPKEDDLTRRVIQKLGIELPEELEDGVEVRTPASVAPGGGAPAGE